MKSDNKEKGRGIVKHTLGILKANTKNFILIGLIILIAYSFLYGIWRIPFIDFGVSRMSAVNVFDYLFILLITIFASVLITLFIHEKKQNISSTSISTVGGIGGGLAGFFASICPVCQGIVIIALGSTIFSIPAGFLTPYSNVFKISSLGLLGLALYLKAESIYTGYCKACNIIK